MLLGERRLFSNLNKESGLNPELLRSGNEVCNFI